MAVRGAARAGRQEREDHIQDKRKIDVRVYQNRWRILICLLDPDQFQIQQNEPHREYQQEPA